MYNPENKNWKDGAEWGLKEGQLHSSPSPETRKIFKNMGEELTNIKICMAEQNKDIKHILDVLETNKEEHEAILKRIDAFIDSSKETFASKLTEKIVYGLVVIVLIAFGTAITNMVVSQDNRQNLKIIESVR